jgi:hypothetical protein
MKKFIIVLLLFTANCFSAEIKKLTADEIIAEYLKLPDPEKDTKGQAHQMRWEILEELKTTPNTAIEAIRVALSKIDNQSQRRELVGAVDSYFRNEESAKLFCELLDDSDDQVRQKAIHGLRMLARRTDRSGPTRRIRLRTSESAASKEKRFRQRLLKKTENKVEGKETFEPIVKGLLPYLIKAAGDSNERNRITAMYALADTRQDGAVKELRKRLKDSSAKVRFSAACFLTEYGDASGLAEMKIHLKRYEENNNTNDGFSSFPFSRGMLIASFERITGKSFGKIPMQIGLYSHKGQAAKAEKQFQYQIKAWANWWAWKPEEQMQSKE